MKLHNYLVLFGFFEVGFLLLTHDRANLDCGLPSRKLNSDRQNRLNSKRYSVNNNNDEFSFTRGLVRKSKIISGKLTQEGQFPWQVSLELLHPSLGFVGHWCGGILIHNSWILSAAHCIHNDLFNLPLPALWTAVLGDHNRKIESGYEQRISVDKIVIHRKYHNFQNDLVLLKLAHPAIITSPSNIRKICIPLINIQPQINDNISSYDDEDLLDDFDSNENPFRNDNYLRKLKQNTKDTNQQNLTNMNKILTNTYSNYIKLRNATRERDSKKLSNGYRINDKFSKFTQNLNLRVGVGYEYLFKRSDIVTNSYRVSQDVSYTDCVATGWGKSITDGNLNDILLQAKVPIHSISRCKLRYGDFVKFNDGHLCAGRLDGKGGTCVGDSGGPLQCRETKTSPWILVGITSFGSGCALPGFPDVYTRISYYIEWIKEILAND